MSENKGTSNESNSLSSDSIIQASRLTAKSVLRAGLLRPSLFGLSGFGSTPSSICSVPLVAVAPLEHDAWVKKTNASMNIFIKEQKDDKYDRRSVKARGTATKTITKPDEKKDKSSDAADGKKPVEAADSDKRPDPLTMLRKNGSERANLFATDKCSIPRVEGSVFVFGQNVHERVILENINSASTAKPDNADSALSPNGLLSSSNIQNAVKTADTKTPTTSEGKDNEAKTLTDGARELVENHAQKLEYAEVETFTGEENELNIVDVNCQLFAFLNSNWEERGRGRLRLNISKNDQECSRILFRTSGNLRLLLNTKVWAEMVAERASQKSLRLTAMDNTGKINVYLAMARPEDINLLHKALVERIEMRKALHPEECRASIDANNGDESKNGVSSAPIIEGDVVIDLPSSAV